MKVFYDKICNMKLIADIERLNQNKPANLLVSALGKLVDDETIVYYNFPLYRGDLQEELRQVEIMMVSCHYGIVYFKCINSYRKLNDKEKDYVNDLYENIYSRLSKDSLFRKNRKELNVGITSAVVICDSSSRYDNSDPDFFYVSLSKLNELFADVAQAVIPDAVFKHLITCVEGTRKVVQKRNRKVIKGIHGKRTKSEILNDIQEQEATFDVEQKKTALVTIEGPQRIRGLAGSGKTIVLTMKAALYHLQNPDEEILYTYYTKSLYGLIHGLIDRYYRDFSDNKEPNWNKIHILHGWGGAGVNGVYYQACLDNGISALTYSNAVGHGVTPFEFVCSEMLKNNLKPKYDLTLIDEGQDFPNSFYRLCYKLSVNKKIVWAYDDFQNIFDVNLQDEKETFGKDENGNYYVDFNKMTNPYRDIILHVCYRNPRTALIFAFSLGLGIYNERVLQRLTDNEHWKSLGFVVEQGDFSVGCEMVISRPQENSPSYLNEEYGFSVGIIKCESLAAECEKISSLITKDIQEEGLNPEDICVICLDDRNIQSYYTYLGQLLLSKGIRVYDLLHAAYTTTTFYQEGHVTLGTLNKAKGNEAGMVYIMGVDKIFNDRNNVILRNRLFTAITRTKGWVVLSGEKSIEYCSEEMEKLQSEGLKLHFIQPSEESTKTIFGGSTKRQNQFNDIQRIIQELQNEGMSFEDIMNHVKAK